MTLTVEEAYDLYRTGQITYEEYRRKYANPADEERLEIKRLQAVRMTKLRR